MVTVKYFNCPYVICKLTNHQEIKNQLLSLIHVEKHSSSILDMRGSIAKTDWNIGADVSKKYFQFLQPHLIKCLDPVYKEILKYPEYKISNYWFQQYQENDTHNWHTHPNSSWANIYYADLSESGPRTEILSPEDNKTIIIPEVSEGDILIIPAFLTHRSAPNLSNRLKTVIAFNVS